MCTCESHPACSAGGTEQRGCRKHLLLFTETHVTNPVRALKLKNIPKKKKKKNVNRLAGVGPGSCLTCRDVSSLAWLNAQSERLKPRGSLYTRDISAVMLL